MTIAQPEQAGLTAPGNIAALAEGVLENIAGAALAAELAAPEKYQLGRVIAAQEVHPGKYGLTGGLMPRATIEVHVHDPYLDLLDASQPGAVAAIREQEARAGLSAKNRRELGAWRRRPEEAYIDAVGVERQKTQWGDPVSNYDFFHGPDGLNNKALEAWLTHVPSAEALRYLCDPVSLSRITDNEGNSYPVDDTARAWLSACTDAVAIRSRGSLMAQLVKDYATEHPELRGDMRWMSVACGTALPAMKGAVEAGLQPQLVLLDIDVQAMQATQRLAPEIGFTGVITQVRKNIFDTDSMAHLRDQLTARGDQRPHLMDLMGIFEYTGEELGVDPAQFLRSNYDLLMPGGMLVFGQMRTDRPVPDFTMGVVQWPYVSMRTPGQVMEIVREAGIPSSAVRMYLPEDSVYMVGAIDKPMR